MIWFLSLLILSVFLMYRGTGMRAATLAVGAWLLVYTVFGCGFGLWTLLLWVLFLGIAVALNVDGIRRGQISSRLLAFYRANAPALSETEQQALTAGNVWWDAELFFGDPDWRRFFARAAPRLTDNELNFIEGPLTDFCAELNQWGINQRGDLSAENWNRIKDLRLCGMGIPESYGGLGFSLYAQSRVLIKLGSVSQTAAITVGVPNSLGPAELLLHYGTDEQKEHYLPRLARGEDIPCFALTEPNAGSDATSLKAQAVVCKGQWQGEEVLGMRLTFDKRYITLAPVATLVGLAFRLVDPDGLLGDEKDLGITCALIPADTAGIDIGRRHKPLTEAFQNGPIRGDNVFVPLDTIIGGPGRAGEGWKMLVESLSTGRAFTLPASGATVAVNTALLTGSYARLRQQFGLPIGQFEGIAEVLGRLGGRAWLADSLCALTINAIDQGERPAVSSGISKCHTTELARQNTQDAMDVHGGKGIMQGPANYLGHAWETAPITITVEGANILTRSMMIFGQGLIRCHPFMLKEIEAAALEDDQEALDRFDELWRQHVGHLYQNGARAFVHALTGARLVDAPGDGIEKRYAQQITRYGAALATASEFALLMYGGELKRAEMQSARLGDVLSWLYMASAVLKRHQDQGQHEADLPLLQWAGDHALHQAEQALDAFIRNLPNRLLRWKLRAVALPFGCRRNPPSDAITKQVAELLLTPGEARERLARDLHHGEETALSQLSAAVRLVLRCEPIEARIAQARKVGMLELKPGDELIEKAYGADVISEDEADLMEKRDKAVAAMVAVDDFSPDAFKA